MKKAVMIIVCEDELSVPQFFNAIEEAKEKAYQYAMRDTRQDREEVETWLDEEIDKEHDRILYSMWYDADFGYRVDIKIFWMDIDKPMNDLD